LSYKEPFEVAAFIALPMTFNSCRQLGRCFKGDQMELEEIEMEEEEEEPWPDPNLPYNLGLEIKDWTK
jgi:hypothetical protein